MNLKGLRVVLTRPQGQNEGLAEAIRAAGGTPIIFPVLAISDPEDTVSLLARLRELATYDLAIFISPNATHRAMALIRTQGGWPAGLSAATVGPASAQALRDYGVTRVLVPTGSFDSEHLLALPELQSMQGKRVLIFRGQGGRELLAETLRARGAHVDYAECYRRVLPDIDPQPLRDAGALGAIDAIVATSSEGLRNLHAMLGPQAQSWLFPTPLFLPHARIAEEARKLGHSQIVATAPGDDGLLSALGLFSARVGHP
ncbi:MAG TPA: uroporphyrinogen-III synthase [Burkholderiales bacterium]|nr:uroporphyrinogen-III synthase [Burkholderiales bacterium]